MKICRQTSALLLLVVSALTATHALQAGENNLQPNSPGSSHQQASRSDKLPETKRVKASDKPSPEDTLPACSPQQQAEWEEKKTHPTPSDPTLKMPHMLQYADARYSKEARKKRIQGTSTIALTVATDGLPKDMCILKSLGYGLDEEAALAVRQYRFAPATKNGEPIAVPIRIEVRFRLY